MRLVLVFTVKRWGRGVLSSQNRQNKQIWRLKATFPTLRSKAPLECAWGINHLCYNHTFYHKSGQQAGILVELHRVRLSRGIVVLNATPSREWVCLFGNWKLQHWDVWPNVWHVVGRRVLNRQLAPVIFKMGHIDGLDQDGIAIVWTGMHDQVVKWFGDEDTASLGVSVRWGCRNRKRVAENYWS